MDKISIVSSQAVLEMSSFSMDTRSMSSSPLVNSLVKNWLFKTAPDVDELPFQFIHTMDLAQVDMTLHDSPDLVIYRNWVMGCLEPQLGRKKVWRFLITQQFNCCTCAVRCPAGTKSFPDTAYRWQQYDVIMTSWNSVKEVSRDITRISRL